MLRIACLALGVALWPLSLVASTDFRAGVLFDVPLRDGAAKAFVFNDRETTYLHLLNPNGTVITYRLTPLESPQPKPESPMVKWVKGEVAKVQKHADLSLALAATFSDISSRITKGELKTPLEIITATAAANAKVLDNQEKIEAWAGFREALREKLNAMAEAGELKTPEDHIRIWNEIAEGLKYAVAAP